ncbi:MAG: bifunctional pyr operon transcriptional regulator/uracil phosphoribosyltransferase PyrR [Candidatus Omnitrophica bacterium]|nr:bifunctional pyr operon transcriptional regulator/uracil phosphoribosyltransferase PyrR [Candidatus Omnitrophota bacterium]MBU2043867.1 bifunctional pyr operon transcriptional regulator/uracil phosphoribosyltransferase PyrR [Candidatus Omnitrophota bacterium]MBU2251026.1 bifunctional pyr operon transcriptional regulator/uracil phosphoribosyltransferase PyrR [Candidatus Omnitrophota bacterium]MBU2266249.1 bifunctional pyr operon transcriptional regulator/uracil phosphoribosyltransferase PyrR [
MEAKIILSSQEVRKAIQRLTHQILERDQSLKDLVLIGIQTRGVCLARRIQAAIKELKNQDMPLGVLDITFYRDDLTAIGSSPVVKETNIEFDLNDKRIVLIDDVLFTGRTIRAALDEIMDFGRPKTIELLVLIDRGHRQLPIRPDFVGKNIPTSLEESVEVKFQESDGSDEVTIINRQEDKR